MEDPNELDFLNNDLSLDFLHTYYTKYTDAEPETDPYASRAINSMYYNMSSLSQLQNADSPLYISLNIQSLNSKFEQLKEQILNLVNSNVKIDVISLQETWELRYPDTLKIPGFQEIIFKSRLGMRGGGMDYM
jgi:hypothetical protein